uniref:BED-type domain-containing protein n=1 Tax=Ditylenchus dipsaci TaxID=166011 RepID=A0A915EGC3_9BILA
MWLKLDLGQIEDNRSGTHPTFFELKISIDVIVVIYVVYHCHRMSKSRLARFVPEKFIFCKLCSSIGSSGSSSSPNFFSPNNEEYGAGSSRYGGAKQGSNIEAIVDALSRSGAKRAEPAEAEAGAASLLSQFFGGRKR